MLHATLQARAGQGRAPRISKEGKYYIDCVVPRRRENGYISLYSKIKNILLFT
jgi:hypothetical protein